jgi:hypothetical protein
MSEHIREGFTNLRSDIGKSIDRYYLSPQSDGDFIGISDLPILTLPCNYLASFTPEENKGGYYPPAKHVGSNASLNVTSFTIGDFSYEAEIGNDGIVDVGKQVDFKHNPYIYRPKFAHRMRQSEEGAVDSTPGTIQLGPESEEIVDDYGVLDGLSIHADGASIYLPEWDLVLKPDDFLENAPYAGATNNVGLKSEIEENICHDRAYFAEEAEIGRINFCELHMAYSKPHDHAASNNPSSCDGFSPSNAFDNCKSSCKGGSVNREWLSNCNPCFDDTRRVDAAHNCGCGGFSCDGEDLSCGWEMILNAT